MNEASVGSQMAAERVRAPIPGLYNSIDPDTRSLHGWSWRELMFREPLVRPDTGRTIVHVCRIRGPNRESGNLERAFNPSARRLELRGAFRHNLPRWIESDPPLAPGRGTPTIAFFTLYQMRRLGVGYGQLRLVKLRTVENVDAILQLAFLLRRGEEVGRAILRTHSVWYAETALIQSGHEIIGTRVSGGVAAPIGPLLRHYEGIGDPADRTRTVARHEALLRRYGFSRDDALLHEYNVELDVQFLPPAKTARPLLGGD